ncbi:penicillin-binding protein 1C [Phaeovulum sp. W22_SRMD_FR3]|uniref:penicillin-binding protein 1C n=1 Tax=Phaeovulum sp. W22_SRMD_FR3 TaxID=3240274 RepID=UPI003F994E6C
MLRRSGLIWAVVALTALAAARDGFDAWVAATDLPPLTPELGVEVVARDGSLLRAFQVSDGRWRLDPGPVDPGFVALLLGYEDRRFYDHAGVDPWAVLRAGGQALRAGHIVSGGSTLTMQVARLLEEGPTGKVSGKIRQARVALALERRLSKPEILQLYLELAPYGGNLEGVRAASLAYFGKEPRRLTEAEAALLVALPQSPEARRPDRAPELARAARDRVLALMAARGVLAPDRVRAAQSEAIPSRRRAFPALAPHLAARLMRAKPGAIRIETTIDAALQRAAERLAARAVSGLAGQVSAGIVLADHQTGEILAEVGAANWRDGESDGFVDMTQALRSPGSTLKPFVYALAFDEGLAHPETLIEDRPMAFGSWRPQNFDRQFRGTITMREALWQSLNLPVVQLTQAIGPARLLATLRRAGARVVLPGGQPGLAVALGGLGISLEDLVAAYAGLARLGRPITLSAEPGLAQPRSEPLFSAVSAWQVMDILSGLTPPPGAAPNRLAWKTGTSYGNRDALAVGFDGRHVAGVWLGRPDGTPVPGAFGGELAAPILFELFDRLKRAPDPLPPPPPATLMVDNPHLPQPLQRYRPRDAVFAETAPDAPELTFPPDGAEVEAPGGALAVKLRGGTPPFTWLADGRPVALALRARETVLQLPGPGFVALSVIDAKGRSAGVQLRLR